MLFLLKESTTMDGIIFSIINILEGFSLDLKTGEPLGDPLLKVVAECVFLPLLARDGLTAADLNKT